MRSILAIKIISLSARSARSQNIRKRIVERILSARNVKRKNIQQIAATTALADQRIERAARPSKAI